MDIPEQRLAKQKKEAADFYEHIKFLRLYVERARGFLSTGAEKLEAGQKDQLNNFISLADSAILNFEILTEKQTTLDNLLNMAARLGLSDQKK